VNSSLEPAGDRRVVEGDAGAVREGRARRLGAYALALASVAVAIGLTLALGDVLSQTRLLLPLAVVIAAAAFGGTGPAAASAIVGFVGTEYFVFGTDIRTGLPLVVVYRGLLFGAATAATTWLIVRLRAVAGAAVLEAKRTRALALGLEAEAERSAQNASQAEGLARQLEELNERLVATNLDVERAAARARRIQTVTSTLLRSITPAQVAEAVVAQGEDALDAEVGMLALLTPDGRGIRLASAAGFRSATLEGWRMLPLDSPLPLAVAVRTGEQVWLPSVPDNGEQFPISLDNGDGARPWIVLPLVLRERPIGALALGLRTAVEFADDDRTFLTLLGQQCAQALERARLYEAERNARVRAEFAERQLSFLAEASTRLAASLDYEATLVNVAQLIVPDLADWCTVHILHEDGRAGVLALVHRNRDKTPLLRTMEEQYPGDRSPDGGVRQVIATGKPELLVEVRDETLVARSQDEEHLRMLRKLAPRSLICVPILARDRTLGAITMVTAGSGRRYTTTDLSLAEELAARVGQAIDNAQLYQTTRLASQAKSDFLAIMSHELRTPLNAILGYADLVLLGVPEKVGDQAHHQIERVRNAAQHLLQLVDEVLSYARLESGKEVAKLEPVELGAIVRESASLAAPLADRKGLTFRVHTPDEPVRLETDGWKVRQILSNLLSNAVKFTYDGDVTIDLTVDETTARIVVRDTGIGIPAAHLGQIFDPFWQVEHTSTRRFGGTGLGLGVARELARLLGGDVTVTSEPDRGSTFTLSIPLVPPADIRTADKDPFEADQTDLPD
jgi:signal transduction histidine kinase